MLPLRRFNKSFLVPARIPPIQRANRGLESNRCGSLRIISRQHCGWAWIEEGFEFLPDIDQCEVV